MSDQQDEHGVFTGDEAREVQERARQGQAAARSFEVREQSRATLEGHEAVAHELQRLEVMVANLHASMVDRHGVEVLDRQLRDEIDMKGITVAYVAAFRGEVIIDLCLRHDYTAREQSLLDEADEEDERHEVERQIATHLWLALYQRIRTELQNFKVRALSQGTRPARTTFA